MEERKKERRRKERKKRKERRKRKEKRTNHIEQLTEVRSEWEDVLVEVHLLLLDVVEAASELALAEDAVVVGVENGEPISQRRRMLLVLFGEHEAAEVNERHRLVLVLGGDNIGKDFTRSHLSTRLLKKRFVLTTQS